MNGASVTARLTGGAVQQRLYAEPTAVHERCVWPGHYCLFDHECCPGWICEWGACE